jgi:hypothetical protein
MAGGLRGVFVNAGRTEHPTSQRPRIAAAGLG